MCDKTLHGLTKTILGLLLSLLVPFSPASAQEVVTIPAYAPVVGSVRTFQTEKSVETDMSVWLEKPSITMHGDFLQQMMVVSKDDQAIRMRWLLSSDTPAKTGGDYDLNAQYQVTLDAYGLKQLEFDADLNGFPSSLVGYEAIRQNMQEKIAKSFGNGPVP